MNTIDTGKASLADLLTPEQLDLIGWASVGKPRRHIVMDVAPAESAAPAPSLVFDTKRREFQIDPYPVFAQFRRDEPVHRAPPPFDGWFVFCYDDVVRVCDETQFSAANSTEPQGLFQLDGQDHATVLHKVKSAWDQGAAGVGTFLDRSIASALDAIGKRTEFDLVDDFARPIPRDVYFDILGGEGIKPDKRAELDELARTVMKHHDHTLDEAQSKPGAEAGAKLAAQLMGMLVGASSNPNFNGSFLAHLAPLVDRSDSSPFNRFVAAKTLVSLTVAGYMSVEFLLATGIRRLLLDDATWWKRVRANGELLPRCLEEMRRCEHALSVVDRFAKQEIAFGSVMVPKGARVFGVLASANRDERVYGSDADTFLPGRKMPKAHLGLGHGTHECMGRALERLITKPAISALMEALPDLRLQSDEQPPWFGNFYFRSFDHLKVTTK